MGMGGIRHSVNATCTDDAVLFVLGLWIWLDCHRHNACAWDHDVGAISDAAFCDCVNDQLGFAATGFQILQRKRSNL